ncbi:alpha/beta hydrolase [Streptomyces viridiviolaceus]
MDVRFPSGDGECAGWLYVPERVGLGPVIVLGHGLGGVKEMRLDAYAERFVAAGYACLVFDYRHFGASSGEPRQLLDIGRQLADWKAAVAYARSRPEVRPDQVVVWGTSFGGGHVIVTAADDPGIAAVISQCPFTDGLASALALSPASSLKVTAYALRDLAAAARGRPPVLVPAAGPVNSAALMTAPDALPGYLSLAAAGTASSHRNELAARIALNLIRYRPGRRARDVACPILFGLCERDSVAPSATAQRYAATAPRAETRLYDCGHFDTYLGPDFERAVADQLAFLTRHIPIPGPVPGPIPGKE